MQSPTNNRTPTTKRVGIVDDEPYCIEQLRTLITTHFPNIEIIFEAKSIKETRSYLNTTTIDGIFLDVQLGDGTAFELLKELNENIRIVFVTGFDQYAVRAFEVNALDYILKPIQIDRLKRTLEIFTDKEKQNKTLPLIRPDDEVVLREDDHAEFISINDILYIEADRDYTRVHTKDRTWYMRRSLNTWEETLPVTLFLRIHRSIIANMDHFESVKKTPTGSCLIHIHGIEKPLLSSRRYGKRLKRFLL